MDYQTQTAYWENEVMFGLKSAGNIPLLGFQSLTETEKEEMASIIAERILQSDYLWEKINDEIRENVEELAEKKYPQAVLEKLTTELEDDGKPTGGTSHEGETLYDFLIETEREHEGQYTPEQINDMLKANGIKPIAF